MSVGTLPVHHDPASAAVVRHELAAELSQFRVEQGCIDDAVLVASELVGNAIRHGIPVTEGSTSGRIDVRWDILDDALVIKVEDGSAAEPRRREAGDRQPDGRGLAIVEAHAADGGVDRTDRGKCVWARIPLQH
ncbi:MAG: ATP-binding protein [Jatrophihabitans sp.]|uniref:ATP-binding protein n=1 Tax=Jatrophihabitans sp. TaxID=1932789 RepID=UPI003F7E0376